MKVHYFYSRKYTGSWFSVKIEAIQEEDVVYDKDNKPGKSFLYLEMIDTMINREPEYFQSVSFKIEFGKSSCHSPGFKTEKDLYNYMKNDSYERFKPITRAQYERIRKMIFAAYLKQQYMDFDLVAEPQKNVIHVL